MVQKADVNASLEAARSVLASQCDAEAGKGDWLDDQGGIAWVYWDRPIGPRLYIENKHFEIKQNLFGNKLRMQCIKKAYKKLCVHEPHVLPS